MRISIDCKAKVKVGNFSRGGKSRCREAPEADDHDMHWDCSMVPLGIHDVLDGDLSLFFGTSNETSDFIMDCIEMWWNTNNKRYSHIEELVFNLDNGPSQKSGRTQFIKRMVQFAKKINIPIHLVYYPPYHSKYNPIEHTFGVLENYWCGALLNSVEAVLGYASNMTYRGKNPSVELVENEYPTGVTLKPKALKPFLKSFQHSEHLPKWDVLIVPNG